MQFISKSSRIINLKFEQKLKYLSAIYRYMNKKIVFKEKSYNYENSNLNITELKKEFEYLANPDKAKSYQRFFKTGKGEYGEGDIFLGITVPEQRKIACKYSKLSLKEIEELLHSPFHEYRLTALIMLVNGTKSKKISALEREELFNFYLKNTRYINNWDLVD